jgi:hypothetical protein
MSSRIPRRHHEEFSIRLTEQDLVWVGFDRTDDEVIQFSVQYMAFLQEEWQPIVRFDTAHGYAHMDISHPNGTQDKHRLDAQDYAVALNWAINQVRSRWEFYRERYEREMR